MLSLFFLVSFCLCSHCVRVSFDSPTLNVGNSLNRTTVQVSIPASTVEEAFETVALPYFVQFLENFPMKQCCYEMKHGIDRVHLVFENIRFENVVIDGDMDINANYFDIVINGSLAVYVDYELCFKFLHCFTVDHCKGSANVDFDWTYGVRAQLESNSTYGNLSISILQSTFNVTNMKFNNLCHELESKMDIQNATWNALVTSTLSQIVNSYLQLWYPYVNLTDYTALQLLFNSKTDTQVNAIFLSAFANVVNRTSHLPGPFTPHGISPNYVCNRTFVQVEDTLLSNYLYFQYFAANRMNYNDNITLLGETLAYEINAVSPPIVTMESYGAVLVNGTLSASVNGHKIFVMGFIVKTNFTLQVNSSGYTFAQLQATSFEDLEIKYWFAFKLNFSAPWFEAIMNYIVKKEVQHINEVLRIEAFSLQSQGITLTNGQVAIDKGYFQLSGNLHFVYSPEPGDNSDYCPQPSALGNHWHTAGCHV